MSQGIVSDNWSLQDISGLFTHGLDDDVSHEIIIENNQHYYKEISYAPIQTEALFDFLSDLVLRDEVLVDQQYEHAWSKTHSPLLRARDVGVVRSYPFLNEPAKLTGPRDKIITHMCSTPSLINAHQENVSEWDTKRTTPHKMLSQVMWGGAGMCARSYVYEKSYTPHPLRKRFFINSGFMLPAGDALHQLTTFLNDEKIKVSKKLYGTDALYSLFVNLPSIPVRVIQEATSLSQIIEIALQLRDEFQPLREWLKAFQNALTDDDLHTINQFRKQLDSVSRHVNNKVGLGSADKPISMEAGLGIFKFSTQFDIKNSIQNKFGIRATLNKLIFGSNGKQEIKKFIKMFGQQGSPIAYEIEQHFTKNA